jgi:outer membrane protein TolC
MGMKPGTPVVLKDSLLSPLPELPGWDTLLQRFQHPDLVQLEAGLAATQAMVEVERGALGPDIFIFAKFNYTKAWVANRDEKNRDVLVTDPINSVSGAFGLGVRWRLNYWQQQMAVRRAELDWRALKRKENYARDGLELYLKDSWMRYRALGDKINEVQKAIEACEALLEGIVAAMDLDPDRAKDLVGPYKSWVDLKSQYYDLVHQRSLVTLEVLRNAGLATRTEYLTRP